MPTYDYQCDKCGKNFEKFEKMTDKPQGKCPKCGGKTRRLIAGGSGVIFKGSGFYETDYKKRNMKECERSAYKKSKKDTLWKK